MTIESKTQLEAWRSRSFSDRVKSERPAFSGAAVLPAVLSESENPLKKLDPQFRAELTSLAQETDAEMFWEGLLVFASRLERAEKPEAALQIYSLLMQNAGEFPTTQTRARVRAEALLGQGGFGDRFEVFAGRFLGEVADYRNLLPMVGCSLGFELAKAWSFGALINARNLPWWIKGMGASVGSSVFGTMVEVPTYLAMSHGLRELSGEKTAWSSQEVWRTVLSFGALKAGSWGGASLLETSLGVKGMETAAFENAFTKFSAAAIPQATSLMSLWTAQKLEERLGLKNPSEPSATGFDIFTTWVNYNVGGALAQRILGKGFAEFNREFRLRQRALLEKGPDSGPGFFSPGTWGFGALGLATANGAPEPYGGVFEAPQIAMMEAKDPQSSTNVSKGPVRGEAHEPNVLWFPSLEEIEGSTPLQYSPEMETTITDLETRIRRSNKRLDKNVSADSFKRNKSERHSGDQVWLYQGKDFARSLGARAEVFGPERLVGPILPGDKTLSDVELKKAVAKLEGSALSVLEIVVPASEIYVGKGNEESVYTDFNAILESMQACLGNKVRLIGVNKRAGTTTLRIPSLSLLEKLLRQTQRERATPFHFVWGEIPRDQMILLRGLGIAPVGFSRDPLWLGDLKIKVHPWFFTWHDLYHAFASSQFAPSLREYAAWLYGFNVQKILPKFKIAEGHLDRLSDLAPPSGSYGDPRVFLDYTMNFVWKTIQDQIETETLTYEGFLKYRHYLDTYRKALAKNLPPRPHLVYWHQEALAAAERSLKRFDEIILETIKAMPARPKKP